SALDLSPAAATTIGLGPGHNDWVDVTFMWEPNVPGYTLDGWGGVHEFNGAPPVSATGYWRGWDIARGIASGPDGASGYTLDGWGGIAPFGGWPPVSGTGPWPGWDLARGAAG